MREPDLVLTREDGETYLRRWHLIPRNRFFNLYLHHFLGSDDDRALHDHPWWFASLILKGGYFEHFGDGWAHKGDGIGYYRWRRPGSFAIRKPKTAHRVELDKGLLWMGQGEVAEVVYPAWTLVATGPRIRSWGFHCPQGWVHWHRFTKRNGCGEK